MKKNQGKLHLLSLGILLLSYGVIHWVLWDGGGILGTGKFLALFTLVIIVCSFLMGGRLTPIITSGGYFVSFLAAFFLQKDGVDPGGGRTNNMWSIWILTFVGFFVLSLFLESAYANKKLPN